MKPYYSFIRVEKAFENRFSMFEDAFSCLVSRENVNIRLYFLQDSYFGENTVSLQTKTNKAMKQEEMDKLAEMTALRVMEKMMGMFKKETPGDDEYVDSKEAARMLGLTPNYLRTMKEKFPHIKVGGSNQGRVLFLKSALLNSYTNK